MLLGLKELANKVGRMLFFFAFFFVYNSLCTACSIIQYKGYNNSIS